MLDAAALLAPPPRVAGLAREADPFGEAPGAPDQHAEAARRLESVAAALRERGVAVETRVEEAERPADAICAAVRGSLADFVAMASRGQRGIERALLGSTAEGVVRHSDVPVLLVTPAAGAL
jgi:nucleotide-binding universal stress UspA family protein